MKHFANIILLLLILTSCQSKEKDNEIAKTEQKEQISKPYTNLVLYDNFDNELILDRRSKKIAAGTIVDLQDNDRNFLAQAAFHPGSKIAARVLERDSDVAIDADWLAAKLRFALAHRERVFSAPFYRLIHAEADGLPGLIIDRFDGVFVVQPNAAWIDTLMPDMLAALEAVFDAPTVDAVSQARARAMGAELEDLA